MALEKYKAKRNFKKTAEPKGKVKPTAGQLAFVVQRHKASHLHYDFRIELEGVLKSWAVPKGPSMNPGDKRLAMMVEDHPFDYKDFEGVIPEGNYGAGIVEIWDKGTVTDIDDSDKKNAEKNLLAGLRKGNLKFRLKGRKLKGEFALVKLRSEQENSWLLIKHNDAYASRDVYNSEKFTPANSPINRWLRKNRPARKSAGTIQRVKKKVLTEVLPGRSRKLASYIVPMLARETDKPFDDAGWIFEIKWDGYRTIADLQGEDVLLYSRNGNTFNDSYPVLVQELRKMDLDATLDGEIVVLDDKGVPDFQLLQDYEHNLHRPICFYVFDLLRIGDKTCHTLPLIERKKKLEKLLKPDPVVRYCDHITEKGKDFFEAAIRKDLEGIIAKKADSLYHPGRRTGEWLKIKNHKSAEVIIAGFTQPTGSRKYFGALILALKKGDKLVYAGHTGTGFNERALQLVHKLLQPLVRPNSPFEEKVVTNTPATWVEPVLLGEVKFTEWTRDGRMRHPVFLRLRTDKKIQEINTVTNPPKMKKSTEKPLKATDKIYTFGRIKVKTTNQHKLFFPEEEITKGDVIDYYISVSRFILPYLKGRPQSLKRNPDGINDPGFYHKDAGDEAPSWVKTKKIFSESANKDIDYIICNNQATLTYLNNLGCIEINPWHSVVGSLDKPDYLVIDLDPAEENTFEQVIEAANVVHDILESGGVPNFCKTSGATGLHVYVPAARKYTYDQLKDLAELICIMAHEQLPSFTSLERNLKKRGPKLYLDHLQNRRGQTIAAPYSLRPKPGATVSAPLHWKEVKNGLSPAQFTMHNAPSRFKRVGDIFSGVLGKGIDLKKFLKKLGG